MEEAPPPPPEPRATTAPHEAIAFPLPPARSEGRAAMNAPNGHKPNPLSFDGPTRETADVVRLVVANEGEASPRPTATRWPTVGAAAAAAFMMMTLGSYTRRADVMRSVPVMVPVYDALGLTAEPPASPAREARPHAIATAHVEAEAPARGAASFLVTATRAGLVDACVLDNTLGGCITQPGNTTRK